MARVRTLGETTGEVDYLELPEKHRLVELDVPRSIEGLTVAEAAPALAVRRLRARRQARGHGRPGAAIRPGAADRFEHGDVLVVLGSEDAIARLQEGRAQPSAGR